MHKDFAHADDIPAISDDSLYEPATYLHIKYKLKNGRTIARRYKVTEEKCINIMNSEYIHVTSKYENTIRWLEKNIK